MRISRKIWGSLVLLLGLLWLVGGIFGVLQNDWRMWLLIFCGTVLVRMGWNLTHERPK
jgi:hypothetical protein